eukprot:TRINITY_DN10337_c0_g2_i3.p1 TRINITY_DN10337_c0_g2~~TRINITY_DN10337_c0_g2_i3.p1  ORF type:complete len:451 (+),score=19.51 TRINITY_DN10337_c0_g2_i3:29-1381(+)
MAAELSEQDLRAIRERRKIFIGGLNFSTDDVELHDSFVRFGRIELSQVMKLRETGTSRGFGFVIFEEPAGAAAAIQAMNGNQLGGRTLRVNYAQSKADSKAMGLDSARRGGPPPRDRRDGDQRFNRDRPPPSNQYNQPHRAEPVAPAVYQGQRGGTYGSGYLPRSYGGERIRNEAPRYDAPAYNGPSGPRDDPYSAPAPAARQQAPAYDQRPGPDYRGSSGPRDRGGYDRNPTAGPGARDVRDAYGGRPPLDDPYRPRDSAVGRGGPPPVDNRGPPPGGSTSRHDARGGGYSAGGRPGQPDRYAPPGDRYGDSAGYGQPAAYDPRGPPPGRAEPVYQSDRRSGDGRYPPRADAGYSQAAAPGPRGGGYPNERDTGRYGSGAPPPGDRSYDRPAPSGTYNSAGAPGAPAGGQGYGQPAPGYGQPSNSGYDSRRGGGGGQGPPAQGYYGQYR